MTIYDTLDQKPTSIDDRVEIPNGTTYRPTSSLRGWVPMKDPVQTQGIPEESKDGTVLDTFGTLKIIKADDGSSTLEVTSSDGDKVTQ